MKLIKIIRGNGKFLKDCPYNKIYEAINRHFIAKVGDEVCKYCKHNKGLKLMNEVPYIKCDHNDELDKNPYINDSSR